MWFIFAFIGLWHDLKTRWLAWALTNAVFFSLEILILFELNKKKYGWLWIKWYYRHLVSLAGCMNIVLLMIANLSILHGFDDTPLFIQRAFLREGIEGTVCLVGSLIILYLGVMVMYEKRSHERSSNQAKKF